MCTHKRASLNGALIKGWVVSKVGWPCFHNVKKECEVSLHCGLIERASVVEGHTLEQRK